MATVFHFQAADAGHTARVQEFQRDVSADVGNCIRRHITTGDAVGLSQATYYDLRRVAACGARPGVVRMVLGPNQVACLRPAQDTRPGVPQLVAAEFLIDSVLKEMPFPEIFVAAAPRQKGRTDRQQLLVDGQQRISTLMDYVSPDPKVLHKTIPKFTSLSPDERDKFLDYKVAVRDLGTKTDSEIRDIFHRINKTNYVLKSMEVFNARFNGQYIQYCTQLARQDFFTRHEVFTEVYQRRMHDRTFCVTLVTTLLDGGYYKRDEKNEEYLARYNDEFPDQDRIQNELDRVFDFVESLGLPADSRAWKQLDLFTLLVEAHDSIILKNMAVNPQEFSRKLSELYAMVNATKKAGGVPPAGDATLIARSLKYLAAATRAANDKSQRVARGEVVSELLAEAVPVPATPVAGTQ